VSLRAPHLHGSRFAVTTNSKVCALASAYRSFGVTENEQEPVWSAEHKLDAQKYTKTVPTILCTRTIAVFYIVAAGQDLAAGRDAHD
jgi:hypothetical protein